MSPFKCTFPFASNGHDAQRHSAFVSLNSNAASCILGSMRFAHWSGHRRKDSTWWQRREEQNDTEPGFTPSQVRVKWEEVVQAHGQVFQSSSQSKPCFFIIIIFGRNETDHTKSEQHDKAAKTMFVSLKKKQLLVVDFRT